MKNEAEELLRVDALGRVRTTKERREGLLDEFERSGVVAAEFVRMVGIKYSTFASWVQKRRRARGGYRALFQAAAAATSRAALPGPCFVEAKVERGSAGPGSVATLRVELPCGVRMEIADGSQASLAAALLRALAAEARPC